LQELEEGLWVPWGEFILTWPTSNKAPHELDSSPTMYGDKFDAPTLEG
jgi:hypothetical protein